MLKNLRYRFEYAVVWLAIAALSRLPLAWVQALGRGLGRLAYHLGVARRAGRENLEQRLGVNGRERDSILKRAYAGFGQTMLELMVMESVSAESIRDHIDFEGFQALEAFRDQGRGVVCLSAHYGNWEWMGAALVQRGLPVTFLIGTQSNPWVDARFNRHRASKGMKMTRIADIRGALKVLKGGGLVAILHDQDGDKWGTFVPFFGAQASTHSIAILLARRSGAALAYGVARRGADGRSHMRVNILPEPPADLPEEQATAWILTHYNRLLEEDIRQDPGQWLWMHHRWRSIPLHRLAGEERARAERGELRFDTAAQQWLDAASGAPVALETWK